MTTSKLTTRLVVRDAPAALDFYVSAFGATELLRYAEPSGKIVHAELQIGEDVMSLTEEDRPHNRSPLDLDGSAVILTLVVDDADGTGAAMEAAGAEVVFPIDDQYYGRREGRLRDPFGHLWIISQAGDDLSAEEIQRRVDAAG